MLDRYFPLYIAVFLFTLILTALSERKLIPRLQRDAAQPIYSDGPSWHIQKSGTPTMGGLAFLIAISASLSLSSLFLIWRGDGESALSVLLCLFYSLANAAVGIIDDLTKLKRKRNDGLTPRQKIFLQLIISVLFLLGEGYISDFSHSVSFSFGELELGILYYPLALIILLGIVNCANLTDGIDGLASSVAFSIAISLFYISASLFSDVALISSALIGATVGFLIFNIHPARIFMGDTGSLFFGALVASSAFALGNPLIILPISGVYVIEGVSVILQVLFYKTLRRRIFKMAPLHHHLERCGWNENRICIAAMITTFILSVPAYILYLP